MKNRNWKWIGAGLMATCLGIAYGDATSAQSTAAASGDWSAVGTWTPAEPVAGTLATVNGGLTVDVTAAGEAVGTLDLGTISSQAGHVTVASGDLTASGGGLPSIRVGQAGGSTGSLTVNGGVVSVVGPLPDSGFAIGDILVGDVGNGTLTQTAGAVSANDEIVIGLGGASVGSVDVSGGSFETTADGRSILVGFGGNGTLNVSGTGSVRANFDLLVAFLAGSTGAINQSGGTIEAGFLFTNSFTGGAGSTATVNMTGGTFNSRIAYVLGQGNGSTTATHSGGTINVPNGELVVGDGPGNSSSYSVSGTADVNIGRNLVAGRDGIGVINVSGGTIDATHVFLGDFDSSSGTLNISGGSLILTGNFSVGGALASNASPTRVEPDGGNGPQGQALDANGTLIVSGNAATIDVAGNFLANPADKSPFRRDPFIAGGDNSATLVFEAFSAAGTSLIDVAGVADLDGAVIDVDLLGGYSPVLGQTFDLLTASTFGDTGLGTTENVGTGRGFVQAAEDVGVFALSIVTGGNGEILRATFVPEPASFVMAAFAGLAALTLGRRRKTIN